MNSADVIASAGRNAESFRRRASNLDRVPSLVPLAFILPILLLYWQVGGPSALLADPSTGVHIRVGQWILAQHVIPRQALFSFTVPHKPWCDWEWLSDVLFALADQAGGLSGIAAFSLAALCLTSIVVYRAARRHSSAIIAGATCALVMAVTTIHWLARPHLLTWLALAVFCWLLEAGAGTGRLIALAAVMAFWVNLHPGFVAGFLVLGAWLAAAALNWRLSRTLRERRLCRKRAQWCGLALGLCTLATVCNPYFFALHRHIAAYLFSPASVTAHVSEWLSPNFHNVRLEWFELMLPIAAAAGVWHAIKRRFHWCFLIFGFTHLALTSVRNAPLFAIVCAAPLAAAAEEVLSEHRCWSSVRTALALAASKRGRLATAAAWIFAFALLGASSFSPVVLGQGTGIPRGLIRHLPPGRLFTTDHWADYIIYALPGRKVFFDDRNDFYGPAFVRGYLEIVLAEPGWEKILDQYGVSVVLAPAADALTAALEQSASWMRDDQRSKAVVFVRRREFREH